MHDTLRSFLRDETAAVSIEYAVIASSIAVLLVVSLTAIGVKISGWFQASGDAM